MKKRTIGIILLIPIIIYSIFNFISYAGTSKLYIGINATHSNGVGYGIGNPSNAGVQLWNLRNYDSKNKTDESETPKELYCLKANYGEAWEQNVDNIAEYNFVYDLQAEREKVLGLLKDSTTNSTNDVVSDILNDDTGYYKELLWVLDNAYIPGKSDINALLEKIGIIYDEEYNEYYYEPPTGYDYSDKVSNTLYTFPLTETDVKTVQQAVIWYFTNAMLDGDTNFDKKESFSWLTITTDGTAYTNLEDYNKFISSEGSDRMNQINILYNYLIDSAEKNASNYLQENGYIIQTPVEFNSSGLNKNEEGKYEVEISKSGNNYIVGPIKINKNNELDYDIELKITNENNQEISSSNYKFTDSTGTSLGTTNVKKLVGKTEGFYITVAKQLVKQVNIDISMSYKTNTKQLWLSGVENGTTSITLNAEQPAVDIEVSEEANTQNVSLTAKPDEFDLALRKYIVQKNGTNIADTRVPNIILDTLQTETTATYKHRKDPILVKKGDNVTYKISIYNEGNKNGYATEIIDQLPTGLKYIGSDTITSDKNTYDVIYDETTNILKFSAKTNNKINKYITNTLDSETLELTCKVTANPDTSKDKILTNVAWISKAYDIDAGKEISNVGDDIDSRPQTFPTVDKDSIENYKGNSSNKTDLADSTYFYQGEQDDDDFEKLKIEPETTVTVTKTWVDNENQDGIRPDEITVQLLANSTEIQGKVATLSSNNEWTYTFDSLPLNSNGTEIEYSVKETSQITGYDSSVNGFTITNTHEPALVSIPVEKKWEDENNQDGIRPDSVSVQLLAGGKEVTGKTIELDSSNNWKDTFTDLPKYANGTEINYTVSELTVPEGYTSEITENQTNGYVITNTYIPKTISVSVEKEWDDRNNEDGIRPSEVTVKLLANGTSVEGKEVKLNETNSWKYVFTDLPEKQNGNAIEYTIEEVNVPEGYKAKTEGNMNDGYTLINTHKIFDLSLRKYITKVNESNVTNSRVPSIGVSSLETETTAIYKHKKDAVIVEENDVVTYKFAIFNEGEKAGYASQIIDQLPTGLIYNSDTTIVSKDSKGTDKNTYTVTYDTTSNKVIFDIVNTAENPAKELQPYETNNLDMEIIEIKCKVVAQANTTNSITLTNVAWISFSYDAEENQTAKDRDSQPETSPNVNKDNMENYKGNTNNKEDLEDSTYYYKGEQDDDDFEKIVLEPIEVISVTVKKEWADNENEGGNRPAGIDVQLLADGTVVEGKTITLNETNNWAYTYTNLIKSANGADINYTVEEVDVPAGYKTTVTGNMSEGYIITNTAKKFDLSLRKYITKVNGTNVTSVRVPTIDAGALETGTTAIYKHKKDPIIVQENDMITYKLAIFNEGEKTGYASQVIDQLPTGLIYNSDTTVVSKDSTGAERNTYTVTYDITTNKVIFDIVNTTENPAKELQPYETNKLDMEIIELQCKVVPGDSVSNNTVLTNVAWINGAYDTENDKIAEDEDSEPETTPDANKDNTENYTGNTNNKEDLRDGTYHYEGEQDDDDFEKIIFAYEVVEVSVTKVWEDNENQDGIRPSEVTVKLLADGTEVSGKTITLNESNNWSYTYKNLVKKQNGTNIDYTVEEEIPTGYTSEINGDMVNGFTITNTHIPETIDISVEKKWEDNNNQDGKRPTQVTVTLYANGEEVEGQVITLNTTNNWKYTFTNLPKKAAGLDIEYTITETGIPTGYESKIEGNMDTGFTMINTYIPETREITAKKVWEDNNNQDAIRPTSIELILKANGTEVQRTSLTGEGNEWSHTFTGLAKYSNGEEIQYTVEESGVPEGYTSITSGSMLIGFTITNTYTPGMTTVKVTKVWEDNNNQDGIRPESVSVSLLADGTVMEGKTIELSEQNNWTYTYTDLPIKVNGKDVEYTIIENTKIEGYTTTITNNNIISTAGDITRSSEPEYVITNTHETNKIFDLALRKNIIKINGSELTNLGEITRVPNIVEDSLQQGTTATYKHKKSPVKVEENDIVTYQLTIFNEGEKAGYATQIIDQLPTGLIYNSETTVISKDNTGADKNTYKVTYDTTSNKIIFDIVNTAENPAIELEEYKAGDIDYEIIEIKCKVIYEAKVKEKNILTNVAWISGAYDTVDNTIAVDRDSQPETKPNVNKDSMENYKGNSNNKDDLTDNTYYYQGEQDDDDFEKLYVKICDLSLRKFVTQVNGKKLADSREPEIDITPLVNKTDSTAIYKHSKKPLALKAGDTVIYTIRVYNEGEVSGFASEVKDYLPPYLEFVEDSEINEKYKWQISEEGRVITTTYLADKEINAFNGSILDYEDLQIECKISTNAIPDERITNIAEISEYKYGDTVVPEDIDSESDNIDENKPEDKDLPNYKKDEENKEYVPGNEDDDDFEKVYVKEFDLALRKFITQIQDKEVTTRIPQVKYENEKITYEHSKGPITLHVGDIVIYTLRIYNEGEISGYASEISDDIPEYLEYLPEESTNIKYMWKMYDENGEKTENIQEAVKVKTEYLARHNGENNLIQGFDGNTLYYKDIKIAFKVKDPNSNTQIITNYAQISNDTDENGNEIKDKDSKTDKWNEGEDDQDIENIKVEYFDLSILKFVSKVIIEEDGKQKITETGYNGHEDPEPVVKVELHKKKLNNVKVKFGYGITITNEGDIPGYATEITDYVPEGLRFEQGDNPNWTDEGNNVISTRQLEGTLLQPGESKTVEVILTWENGENNLAQKTNIVEISEDDNQYNVSDKDSTPNNKIDQEDDIDLAKVILTIATGSTKTYFTLTLGLLSVVGLGVFLIKKFVI